MANLLSAETPALRHAAEEVFQALGEVLRVTRARFAHVGEDPRGEQGRVFREKAEDEPIEKAGDAKVLFLRDGVLPPGLGVRQLDGFALLQRMGNVSDFPGEFFGDFRRRDARAQVF